MLDLLSSLVYIKKNSEIDFHIRYQYVDMHNSYGLFFILYDLIYDLLRDLSIMRGRFCSIIEGLHFMIGISSGNCWFWIESYHVYSKFSVRISSLFPQKLLII